MSKDNKQRKVVERAGREARMDGKWFTQNPYEKGHEFYREWLRGWMNAKRS